MLHLIRSPLAWLIAGLLVVFAGGVYWQVGQQQRREQVERERVAEEQAEQRRMAELETRRKREQQRLQEELQVQKEVEEKQRQMDIEFRQDELKHKRFTADERPAHSPLNTYFSLTDERNRREAERRGQSEDEAAVQRARAEVDRQRRGLEQRELDEQAVRARRDAAARGTPEVSPSSPPEEPVTRPPFIRPPAARKPS
ncbi:MAG: hypothetical protein IPP88_03230 [Betaproteobacteria bacterium]|nr:hypothetical protein [Betaproteobacteria bacterium]